MVIFRGKLMMGMRISLRFFLNFIVLRFLFSRVLCVVWDWLLKF